MKETEFRILRRVALQRQYEFVEIEIHCNVSNIVEVIERLEEAANLCRTMETYPR